VTSATRKPRAPAKPDVEIPLAPFLPVEVEVEVEVAEVAVELELEQETLDGIVKVLDSVRSAHWVGKQKFISGTKDRENSSKANLVKTAITSIENKLNRHVSTIRNAADPSAGQVERNAKAAGSGGTGKVSSQLLLSG
jgi:hypothetical protein